MRWNAWLINSKCPSSTSSKPLTQLGSVFLLRMKYFQPLIMNREFKVDFIILAGYLKLIPAELIRAYPRSILNIHPSLLPAFGGKGYYGMKVHKAVIASGARFVAFQFFYTIACFLIIHEWPTTMLRVVHKYIMK